MANLPEVGKTYASTLQAGFQLYVENVNTLTEEENDGHPPTFFVEACEPAHVGNAQAIGYDLDEEEWTAHGFTPV